MLAFVWRLPLYNTVHNILTNLVYAGAYAFGRTMSRVSGEDGRKRVKRFATPAVGMGYAAQGLARRLYHLERVRAEPAGDCQQCDGKGSAVTGAVRRRELLLAGFYAVLIAAAKYMSVMEAKRSAIIATVLS